MTAQHRVVVADGIVLRREVDRRAHVLVVVGAEQVAADGQGNIGHDVFGVDDAEAGNMGQLVQGPAQTTTSGRLKAPGGKYIGRLHGRPCESRPGVASARCW
jgi:hypothetical protein